MQPLGDPDPPSTRLVLYTQNYSPICHSASPTPTSTSPPRHSEWPLITEEEGGDVRPRGGRGWGLPLFTMSQWVFPSSLDPQYPERISDAPCGATVLWAPGPQGPLVPPQAYPSEGTEAGRVDPGPGHSQVNHIQATCCSCLAPVRAIHPRDSPTPTRHGCRGPWARRGCGGEPSRRRPPPGAQAQGTRRWESAVVAVSLRPAGGDTRPRPWGGDGRAASGCRTGCHPTEAAGEREKGGPASR